MENKLKTRVICMLSFENRDHRSTVALSCFLSSPAAFLRTTDPRLVEKGRQHRPDGKHWTGKIKGEILVLTSYSAMACPKLRLGPTGSIAVQGTSQSELVDGKPPWKNLLDQSK